jgi:hypothetical protein
VTYQVSRAQHDAVDKALKDVGAITISIAGLAAVLCWQAYIIAVLWGWFMLQFGLPAIGVAHAIGLRCIFLLFRGGYAMPKQKDKFWERWIAPFLIPAVVLGIAWIAKRYM